MAAGTIGPGCILICSCSVHEDLEVGKVEADKIPKADHILYLQAWSGRCGGSLARKIDSLEAKLLPFSDDAGFLGCKTCVVLGTQMLDPAAVIGL